MEVIMDFSPCSEYSATEEWFPEKLKRKDAGSYHLIDDNVYFFLFEEQRTASKAKMHEITNQPFITRNLLEDIQLSERHQKICYEYVFCEENHEASKIKTINEVLVKLAQIKHTDETKKLEEELKQERAELEKELELNLPTTNFKGDENCRNECLRKKLAMMVEKELNNNYIVPEKVNPTRLHITLYSSSKEDFSVVPKSSNVAIVGRVETDTDEDTHETDTDETGECKIIREEHEKAQLMAYMIKIAGDLAIGNKKVLFIHVYGILIGYENQARILQLKIDFNNNKVTFYEHSCLIESNVALHSVLMILKNTITN